MAEAAQTTTTIAETVDGRLEGPGHVAVTGVEEVTLAGADDVTFIGDEQYAKKWPDSDASAALVTEGVEVESVTGKALIFVPDADLAMARVLELFAPDWPKPMRPWTPEQRADDDRLHPTAVVADSASIGRGVIVGPQCVIGPEATIGDRTVLHAGVTVMDESRIGADCVLWPHVTIRERCVLGNRCILHPGVVLGADGFGYRPGAPAAKGGDKRPTTPAPPLVKVPQIGIVRLGDDVEIGANACIDRGKFSATLIDDFTKIDNLVQIGHNCRVGKAVVIAGCAAVAGSVTIGDGARLGGMAGIKDHVTIGAGATLTAAAHLMNDLPDGQTWGGSPAMPVKEAIQQVLALRKLPRLVKQIKSR